MCVCVCERESVCVYVWKCMWTHMKWCSNEHIHLCALPCWCYVESKFSHECMLPIYSINTDTDTLPCSAVIKHSLLLSHSNQPNTSLCRQSHLGPTKPHMLIIKGFSFNYTHTSRQAHIRFIFIFHYGYSQSVDCDNALWENEPLTSQQVFFIKYNRKHKHFFF